MSNPTPRQMLRSKIHRIAVTQCDVEYEGSLTLDRSLMDAADMLPYERIEVFDVDNGSRFATYLIEGAPGSGDCCVNGAAARLVAPGDKLIIVCYTSLSDEQAREHRPRVVLIGERNTIKLTKSSEQAFTRV